jgi:hypothetical protein
MADLPPTLQRAVEIAESFRCPFVDYAGNHPLRHDGKIFAVELIFKANCLSRNVLGNICISLHDRHRGDFDESVRDEIRACCVNVVLKTITFDVQPPHGPENEPDGKGDGED